MVWNNFLFIADSTAHVIFRLKIRNEREKSLHERSSVYSRGGSNRQSFSTGLGSAGTTAGGFRTRPSAFESNSSARGSFYNSHQHLMAVSSYGVPTVSTPGAPAGGAGGGGGPGPRSSVGPTPSNSFQSFTMGQSFQQPLEIGHLEVFAGKTSMPGFRDGPRLQAQFNGPSGLTICKRTEVLFVCDTRNGAIRSIDLVGGALVQTLSLTVVSPAGSSLGPLLAPVEICMVYGDAYNFEEEDRETG